MVADNDYAVVSSKRPNNSEIVPKGRCSCKIVLLEGSECEIIVDKSAKGSDLFEKVTQRLNLWEKDYFGLSYRDGSRSRTWLDFDKRIAKQVKGSPWTFWFEVKFYPPEPNQVQENITRYYLCQQIQNDVSSGKLPCSLVTYALLGSYVVQAQIGDYDRLVHPTGASEEDYLLDFKFAPCHSAELLQKVCELHKAHRGMSSEEAEMRYLETSKSLAMYGVDLHPAKDLENADVLLGVCSSGFMVYKGHLRVHRFPWPKILKISFRRTHFYIKIRPGGFEQRDTTVGFRLANYKAAERLWKCCVEHHTFFRLMSPEPPPKKGVIRVGVPKFRFSGRTHYQARLASNLIERPQPHFQRSMSARFSSRPTVDAGRHNNEVRLSRVSDITAPVHHYYVNSSPQEHVPVASVRPHSDGDQLPMPVYSLKRDNDLVEYALPSTVLNPPHKEYYMITPQKSPSVAEERTRSSADVTVIHKPISPAEQSSTSNTRETGFDSRSFIPIFEQVHPSKSGLVEKVSAMKSEPSPRMKCLSGPNDRAVMEEIEQITEQGPTDVERMVGTDGSTVTTTSCSQVRTMRRTVQRETVHTFGASESNGGPCEYEDHVERSIDVYSDGDIDHDAELTAAIMEATKMDPSYKVEKIEVKRQV